jgi:hypothetical protein
MYAVAFTKKPGAHGGNAKQTAAGAPKRGYACMEKTVRAFVDPNPLSTATQLGVLKDIPHTTALPMVRLNLKSGVPNRRVEFIDCPWKSAPDAHTVKFPPARCVALMEK